MSKQWKTPLACRKFPFANSPDGINFHSSPEITKLCFLILYNRNFRVIHKMFGILQNICFCSFLRPLQNYPSDWGNPFDCHFKTQTKLHPRTRSPVKNELKSYTFCEKSVKSAVFRGKLRFSRLLEGSSKAGNMKIFLLKTRFGGISFQCLKSRKKV